MNDITHGVNPYQSVDGMVAEYNKKEEAKAKASGVDDLCNTPKEEMEPNYEAVKMVDRGRLDPTTGTEIPLTTKARTVLVKQCTPSPEYLTNYDQIKWN